MEFFELHVQIIVSQFSHRKEALEARVHVAIQRVVFEAHNSVLQIDQLVLLFALDRPLGLSFLVLRRILVVDVHLFDMVVILVNYYRLPLASPVVVPGGLRQSLKSIFFLLQMLI